MAALFDLRDALRGLRRDRGYTLTVVFTLALTLADEPVAQPEVAVLSDALWRRRYGADPAIVGRSLVLDGQPRTIVGVLAVDFQLPTARLAPADLFVPIRMEAERVGWEGDH